MMKRAIAIGALSLLFVWPVAAQTTPVIHGQTGSVTISPQTLDWLRQRLAEEEERLRQLQIAIQQVARAVAASQTASQTLVPTPAEAAIPTETTFTTQIPITGIPTLGEPVAEAIATTTRPPLIPPALAPRTPAPVATRPPLFPGMIRSETPALIATRPPLIPGPIHREIPGQPETASTAPLTSPLSPVTIAPIPVTLTEPVAIAPLGPEPSAPVSITPPPVGPPMPSVTIAPPPGTVETVAPSPGPASREPRRTPRILIPTFMPNQPPSATDATKDGLDRTGSPVTIPPGSDGDDLVIPEGMVGSNRTGRPSAMPNADPLRSGQSMAEVRRLKGTPALISRDDTTGSETWTYPDGTLVFRAGRLSARQIASVEVPLLNPIARPATGKAPAGVPITPPAVVKRPAPQRIAATPREILPLDPGHGIDPTPREIPSLDQLLAPEAKPTAVVKKVAGHRERIRTRSRGGKRVTATGRTRTMTARRSGRSIRAARAYKMRRWARAHRRAHRIALRETTPRARVAAMKSCRKCRIARAYLRPTRRATHGRVAGWRGQIRAKSTAGSPSSRVTIIQRR